MIKNDMVKILEGDFSKITREDLVSPDLAGVKIEVTPSQIKNILSLYLERKVTKVDLNLWAEFLCFRDEYVSINSENDESADFYEDMWYVVQKLSTPQIDGEITPETVRQYIKELDKYFKI